ncbi:hypothetical protein HK102_010603, partial [Quaeritorhiza haematococci]
MQRQSSYPNVNMPSGSAAQPVSSWSAGGSASALSGGGGSSSRSTHGSATALNNTASLTANYDLLRWSDHLIILHQHAQNLLTALHSMKQTLESTIDSSAGASIGMGVGIGGGGGPGGGSSTSPFGGVGAGLVGSSPLSPLSPSATSNSPSAFSMAASAGLRDYKPVYLGTSISPVSPARPPGPARLRLLSDSGLSGIVKVFVKKFPEGGDITKANGFALFQSITKEIMEELRPYYEILIAVSDFVDTAFPILQQLVNVGANGMTPDVTPELCSAYLNLLASFVFVVHATAGLGPERKAIVGAFGKCHHMVHGSVEPSLTRVTKCISTYDTKTIVQLQEQFASVPGLTSRINSVILGLKPQIEGRLILTADGFRKLALLSLTPEMSGIKAPDPDEKHLRELTGMMQLFSGVVVGALIAPIELLRSPGGCGDLVRMVMSYGYLLPEVRNETLSISTEFETTVKHGNKMSKLKSFVNETLPASYQTSPNFHRDRREYLRHQLKLMMCLLDNHELLCSKFWMIVAALGFARDEILWYFQHHDRDLSGTRLSPSPTSSSSGTSPGIGSGSGVGGMSGGGGSGGGGTMGRKAGGAVSSALMMMGGVVGLGGGGSGGNGGDGSGGGGSGGGGMAASGVVGGGGLTCDIAIIELMWLVKEMGRRLGEKKQVIRTHLGRQISTHILPRLRHIIEEAYENSAIATDNLGILLKGVVDILVDVVGIATSTVGTAAIDGGMDDDGMWVERCQNGELELWIARADRGSTTFAHLAPFHHTFPNCIRWVDSFEACIDNLTSLKVLYYFQPSLHQHLKECVEYASFTVFNAASTIDPIPPTSGRNSNTNNTTGSGANLVGTTTSTAATVAAALTGSGGSSGKDPTQLLSMLPSFVLSSSTSGAAISTLAAVSTGNLEQQLQFIGVYGVLAKDFLGNGTAGCLSELDSVSTNSVLFANEVYSVLGQLAAFVAHDIAIAFVLHERQVCARESIPFLPKDTTQVQKKRGVGRNKGGGGASSGADKGFFDRVPPKPGHESALVRPYDPIVKSLEKLKRMLRNILFALTHTKRLQIYDSEFNPIEFFLDALASRFRSYVTSMPFRTHVESMSSPLLGALWNEFYGALGAGGLGLGAVGGGSGGNGSAGAGGGGEGKDLDGDISFEVKRPTVLLNEIKSYMLGMRFVDGLIDMDAASIIRDIFLEQSDPEMSRMSSESFPDFTRLSVLETRESKTKTKKGSGGDKNSGSS